MGNAVKNIITELKQHGDPEIARHSQRFFKTGVGEYGEGDIFLGIRVPKLRAIAKRHKEITRNEALTLLRSEYHEVRLLALFLLVNRYNRADSSEREQIYQDYLSHAEYINNWDLVDSSALQIVGHFLYDKDRTILFELARSQDLWERRISIMATFYFIRHSDYGDTLKLAKILLNDREDLIHKAVGWMLREIGNRSLVAEESFLKKHYGLMPRTMLRYAIEKFPQEKRLAYLKGKI